MKSSNTSVLEIGHVFTQHYLVDSQPLKRKVVIFVQSNALFACVYQHNQTCYRAPIKRLIFDQSIQVLLGKQTPALRFSEALDRRCFTIRSANNAEFDPNNQIELEAPGSGDVKYWLRCFLALMTHALGYKLHENLHFINQPVYTADALERCETRLRQGRFDGQFARRKEESRYRQNLAHRLTQEHRRDWRDRAAEIEARKAEFLSLESAIDARLSCAVDGDARVKAEDERREDAMKRIAEYREAEYQCNLALYRSNSQSVKSVAAANKRSASLVTHTNNPIFAPRSTNSTPVLNTRTIGGIHPSKSHPNLPASTPTSPCMGSRRLSGASFVGEIQSPHGQLRLLPKVLPSDVLVSKQPVVAPVLTHAASTPQPSSVPINRTVAPSLPAQAQERMLKLATSTPSPSSASSSRNVPFAPVSSAPSKNLVFTPSYHYPVPEQSQRIPVSNKFAMPKVTTYKPIQPPFMPYHNMFSSSSNMVPALPMTQVYRFQPATEPFDQLAAIKQAAPMPEPIKQAAPMPHPVPVKLTHSVPNLPAAHIAVPRSTSFSIHVSLNSNQLSNQTSTSSKPAFTVHVTAEDVESEAPPSYDDSLSYV